MKILLLIMYFIIITSASIILNENNTVILDEDIDNNLISKIIYQLILKEGDSPIYLYINSPGGEVLAGNNLINYLLYNNKNIICIANYAASMAFAILQACSKRYGTKYSTFMQHQIQLEIKNSKASIDTYMRFADNLQNDFIKFQSKRIGKSESDFYNKIKNDWWLTGTEAIKENVIDDIVLVGCDKDLTKELYNISEYHTNYHAIYTYSRCPLIIEPIKQYIFPPIK